MSHVTAGPRVQSAVRTGLLVRWILGLCAIGLVLTTVVFVDETELVIVARFGRIVAVYDQPEQRGLQFKWPWPVDTVRRFDRRLQLLSPAGREAFTRDRKNVTVEAYVVWKVGDGDAQNPAVTPGREFLPESGQHRSCRSSGWRHGCSRS